jgi:septum formation protein
MLTSLGVPFEVVVPEVEELKSGEPVRVVVENARRKAAFGLAAGDGARALGVDTEVILDGRMLGKAAERAEARVRLEALAGRTHTVLSGVVLYGGARRGAEPVERSGVARSEVTFRKLDWATIEKYLDSGEWRDRAGAYAIQGLGSILIERVEGDFSNVVGLPLTLLLELAPDLIDAASSSGSTPGSKR